VGDDTVDVLLVGTCQSRHHDVGVIDAQFIAFTQQSLG
jgi:hypothetical protein